MNEIAFIAWISYDARSDLLAHHLGAQMHFIHFGKRGKKLQAPIRYIVQALKTWSVLRRQKPNIVLVQVPPIFSAITVCVYCLLHRARYVIDSHSSTFISSQWRWALGVHRSLSRKAITTIVPNADLEKTVRSWGCRVSRLGFTPGNYPPGERFPLDSGFNVGVISSFDSDEPLIPVLEAVRYLPEVNFYVTGDSRRTSGALLENKPGNCHFTGYIPYAKYVGLLREVDVIIDLTNWDHTLLMGAYEAVSLGTPLIVSDWPVLRDYFHLGTVHVPNTAEGIREGVRRAQREQTALRQGILLLREQLQADWDRQLAELLVTLEE
jgi:glycosyltransferase involved in cell wall biosynthesis